MQGSTCKPQCAAALAVVLLTLACRSHPEVLIHPQGGGSVRVPVELAITAEARARGLMYRRDLPPDGGMLFVFPETGQRAFWMKNTPLSLDMIFIDEALRVVAVIDNATPFSTSTLGPGRPSRYVLEVHGGFGKRHNVSAGDRVELRNIPSPSD